MLSLWSLHVHFTANGSQEDGGGLQLRWARKIYPSVFLLLQTTAIDHSVISVTRRSKSDESQ